MNRILTVAAALCFLSSTMFGQAHDRFFWLDAGLKVQYGATGFLNSALADNTDWGQDIGTGLSYGLKLGLNKGANGLTIDLMRSTASQPIEDRLGMSDTEVKWSALELYTLFRNNARLGYFELGPKFSFLDEVKFGDTVLPSDDFTSTEIAAVMGFGAYFIGSGGRFSGIFGVRFEYGVTDLVNESVGAEKGRPINDPSLYSADVAYSSTNPIFAGIVFELNWGIGYYGKASCGGRGKFIML